MHDPWILAIQTTGQGSLHSVMADHDINGGSEDKVNDIGLLASYMVTLLFNLLALHKIWSLDNYM